MPRIEVYDEWMVQRLMDSSAHQRIAVSWWLFENFKNVGVTPGFEHAYPDKNALSIEILTQYMTQLETLEMTYFALREKVLNPTTSFTECYMGIHIKEFSPAKQKKPSPWSGHTMLDQLKGMTVERFQTELGMPTFGELNAAQCGKPIHKSEGAQAEFEAEILRLVDWMYAAVENKVNRPLHEAFMKSKHGMVVLAFPEFPFIHFIEKATPVGPDTCIVDAFEFDNKPDILKDLVDDTRLVGGIIRDLLKLYLRRSPVHSCEGCEGAAKDCEEEKAPPHEEAGSAQAEPPVVTSAEPAPDQAGSSPAE